MAAAAVTTKEFNHNQLCNEYLISLNPVFIPNQSCNAGHSTCLRLAAIKVMGEESLMTKENLTKILRAANDVFLNRRIYKHHKQRGEDGKDYVSSSLEAVRKAEAAYNKIAAETHLKAVANPHPPFLNLEKSMDALEGAEKTAASAAAEK